MLNPIGISSTRISSLFVSQQLLTQMEGDQTEMYKLQEELASGHAFSLPSENPSAALQVIGLQRQLANNGQSQTNLQSAKTYLNMTDSILGTVSQTLNTVQGVVVSVVGATASDQQRQAAAAQVQQAIQELTQQADTQFNGRYLFAGAATATQPYTVDGNGLVHYRGDTSNPMTYADTGLLVDTGVNGDETFGGLSPITSSSTSFTRPLPATRRFPISITGKASRPVRFAFR